jgi:hypothetical protein
VTRVGAWIADLGWAGGLLLLAGAAIYTAVLISEVTR